MDSVYTPSQLEDMRQAYTDAHMLIVDYSIVGDALKTHFERGKKKKRLDPEYVDNVVSMIEMISVLISLVLLYRRGGRKWHGIRNVQVLMEPPPQYDIEYTASKKKLWKKRGGVPIDVAMKVCLNATMVLTWAGELSKSPRGPSPSFLAMVKEYGTESDQEMVDGIIRMHKIIMKNRL